MDTAVDTENDRVSSGLRMRNFEGSSGVNNSVFVGYSISMIDWREGRGINEAVNYLPFRHVDFQFMPSRRT